MMFRQIKVARQQWDLQRILWRETPTEELLEYWLTVVTYGMTSSAHNSVRALLQCAKELKSTFPEVERIVTNDFYMDDCVSGCDGEDEALVLIKQLDIVLKTAGFELRKWKSNSEWLANKFNTDRQRSMLFESEEQTTVLGLQWLIDTDQFTFVVRDQQIGGKVTKRRVLSAIAKLYDPNGYLAPVIILGKILIQDIWRVSREWDQELPDDLQARWVHIWQEIKHLERFKINRWLQTSRTAEVQLHGFSDASITAYGAVIYARVTTAEGEISSRLVIAKTKVAPLKTVTIPRLELAAAELLSRLLVELRRAMEWEDANYSLWTDSMVTLHWLPKLPRDLKTYVANRVSAIQTNTDIGRWRHVGTRDNPADLLSRGIMPAELIDNKLWLSWLCQPESEWPAVPLELKVPAVVESEMCVCAIGIAKEIMSIWMPDEKIEVPIVEYASDLNKALNIVGYVLRYIQKLRTRAKRRRLKEKLGRPVRGLLISTALTPEERATAMRHLIGRAQEESYAKDISSLQKNGQLTEGSKIESLKPIFDSNGILRVGGRLHRSSETYEMRHPVIVPNGTRLLWLIINDTHRKTKHGSIQLMTQVIRQRFWIPKIRDELRNYIHKCVICARYNYRLEQQLMSELPADRLQPGKPFLHTGVDYAGPFMTKILDRTGKQISIRKTWVAIFVCLKTRAIHIDLVGDLTSVSFLACYERFISRRGRCERMYSDNGTSFVGAAKEIKRAWEEWWESELFSRLSNNGTEWIFMIPAAPHQGGIYEAAVKSMKYHLKRIVGQRILEGEQFLTLLIEIEAVLNSRPIYPLHDDPTDFQALTPGHFLIGEPIVLPPQIAIMSDTNLKGIRLWKERQTMVQHFWKRWKEEYLVTLQERKKWRREKESFRMGQLVIIKNENLPPGQWSMGRVDKLIHSRDGIVRSVVVRTETGQLVRPVQKICILPVETQGPE